MKMKFGFFNDSQVNFRLYLKNFNQNQIIIK